MFVINQNDYICSVNYTLCLTKLFLGYENENHYCDHVALCNLEPPGAGG